MTGDNHHFLEKFFYPESVAVVGASNNKMKPNYYLVANLVNLNYPGKIYPVNPNEKEIFGLKAYPDVASIDGPVDLVVISVPYDKTLGVVKECVARKMKRITIIAGGFSESGPGGAGIQDEILSLITENGIRVVGPNALSPINTENNFSVAFGNVYKLPRGGLAFVFQSGLYQPRFNWLVSNFNLGLSKLIDLGNKMDITEVDALEYLAADPETKVIAIHLESIAGDAGRFMELIKQTTLRKPVIVLKSGRTEAGAKAASSHTGAIARSSDIVFDTALKQAGAIRAQGLDDFFDMSKAFQYLPPLRQNRIALSMFSGGEGVIATDACQLNGFTLAELSPDTRKKLRTIFPPWGDIPVNPFDHGVSLQFHDFVKGWEVLLHALVDDPNVDCLAIQSWAVSSSIAEQIVKLFSRVVSKGKPIVTWLANPAREEKMADKLDGIGVPVFPSAERAIRALAAVYRYYSRRNELSHDVV